MLFDVCVCLVVSLKPGLKLLFGIEASNFNNWRFLIAIAIPEIDEIKHQKRAGILVDLKYHRFLKVLH